MRIVSTESSFIEWSEIGSFPQHSDSNEHDELSNDRTWNHDMESFCGRDIFDGGNQSVSGSLPGRNIKTLLAKECMASASIEKPIDVCKHAMWTEEDQIVNYWKAFDFRSIEYDGKNSSKEQLEGERGKSVNNSIQKFTTHNPSVLSPYFRRLKFMHNEESPVDVLVAYVTNWTNIHPHGCQNLLEVANNARELFFFLFLFSFFKLLLLLHLCIGKFLYI